MSDRDAFLAAIRDEPEADAPRLVFADWLDEQDAEGDHDRAEFVRLQCRLAADPYGPGSVKGRRREAALLRKRRAEWLAADGLPAVGEGARFRRGFAEVLTFRTPSTCQSVLGRVARQTPLRGVAILDFGGPNDIGPLLSEPEMRGLRSFGLLGSSLPRPVLYQLSFSLLMRGLRELALSTAGPIGEGDWRALAQAFAVAPLETLLLRGRFLGGPSLQPLLELRSLSLLNSGRAARTPGTTAVCEAVTTAHLPALTSLDVAGHEGGVAALEALAAWPGLARLTRLGFSGQRPWPAPGSPAADRAFAALFGSSHWGPPADLDLADTVLTLDHLEQFLASPRLGLIRRLSLGKHHGFGDRSRGPSQDEAARMLVKCPHLAGDLELHLAPDGLGAGAALALKERFGDGLHLSPEDAA